MLMLIFDFYNHQSKNLFFKIIIIKINKLIDININIKCYLMFYDYVTKLELSMI